MIVQENVWSDSYSITCKIVYADEEKSHNGSSV